MIMKKYVKTFLNENTDDFALDRADKERNFQERPDMSDDFDEEDEDDEDIQSGAFIDNDGWDEEALEDVGLIYWLDTVERVSYEIRNARRGSYGINGDRAEDLIQTLEEIKDSLDDVLDRMHEEL